MKVVLVPLNPPALANYLKSGGTSCPFCGSTDIIGDEIDFDGGQLTQEVHCQECDEQWVDSYKLISAEQRVYVSEE